MEDLIHLESLLHSIDLCFIIYLHGFDVGWSISKNANSGSGQVRPSECKCKCIITAGRRLFSSM